MLSDEVDIFDIQYQEYLLPKNEICSFFGFFH